MEEFVIYLLKSGIWLAVFWSIYWFFLRKETFFRFNRIFLLLGLGASFLFPLLQYRYVVALKINLINVSGSVATHTPSDNFTINWILILISIYIMGAVALLLRHLIGLDKIRRLIKRHVISDTRPKIVSTPEIKSSFSFFGYVFIDASATISETEKRLIYEHEKAHVEQRHWIDLLCSQVVCAVQWFNPFAWLYLHAIKQNHEFLADRSVLQKGNSMAVYHAALINYTLKTPVFALANSFAHYNKFKRIHMMKKDSSKAVKKMAALLLLPALAVFLWAFAKPEYQIISQEINENKMPSQITVIQDTVVKEDKVVVVGYGTMKKTTEQPTKTTKKIIVDGKVVANVEVAVDNVVQMYADSIVIGSKPKTAGHITAVSVARSLENAIVVDSIYINCDVNKLNNDSQTGAASVIKVRGTGKNPLYIVDGVEISETNRVDPNTIESITILKDASATAIYGEKGNSGVVIITTKKKK